MGQVIIRNLDDDVIRRLKSKAELRGTSLEQLLREVLTEAAPLSGPERLALVQRIQAMTPGGISHYDSTELIRTARDQR
jgi:plasmid stability protein